MGGQEKLVRCAKCSGSVKSVYHRQDRCPVPRLSRWGWNIEQCDGMERALMSGQDPKQAVRDWTW